MKLLTTLLLAALLGTATASAQTTYKLGVRGGLNRATTTLDAASTGTGFFGFRYLADKSGIYAWQAGAVLEIGFGKFALQPALLFSQKGEQFNTAHSFDGTAGQSGANTQSTNRYNWLELPVNVVYTVRGLQLFAGPYGEVWGGDCGAQRSTTRRLPGLPPTISMRRLGTGRIHPTRAWMRASTSASATEKAPYRYSSATNWDCSPCTGRTLRV